MHVEVSVALNFVISYLYNKLPRRRVDMLAEELERGLKRKFQGHWYPDKPFKGSGFRCVRMNGEKVDPVFIHAASECGLSLEEVKSYLPEELTVWIDPAEVSYRIGEKGQIKILYSDRKDESTETADREIQAAGRAFNPDAQCFKPIDNLSASLNNICLSPVMLSPSSPTSSKGWSASASTSPSSSLFNSTLSRPAPPATLVSKDNPVTQFTAASFAQTKFGSTKLKTNAKRPTRLSPTELGNFFRQRSSVLHPPNPNGYCSPQRPRSLSPRDPRLEFYMDQKNRVFLSQQQLHHQQLQQMQPQHLLHSPQHGSSPSSPISENGMVRSPMSSHGYVPGHLNDFMSASSPLTSPANSVAVSPDSDKSFMDGINLNNISYTAQYPHMLLAN